MDIEYAKCSSTYYRRVATFGQKRFSFNIHVKNAFPKTKDWCSDDGQLSQVYCHVDCWFIPGNQPNCCSKCYKPNRSFQQHGAHQLLRLSYSVDDLLAILWIPNGQTVDCNLRTLLSMPKMQLNAGASYCCQFAKRTHHRGSCNCTIWADPWVRWLYRLHSVGSSLGWNSGAPNSWASTQSREFPQQVGVYEHLDREGGDRSKKEVPK